MLEDPREIFRGNAEAIVADGDGGAGMAASREAQGEAFIDGRLVGQRVFGVADKVYQDLHHLVPVH